MLECGV